MSQSEEKEPFLQDVFPVELEEINKRRQALHLPDIPSDSVPSAKLHLVGLALSGGGLRSATFSLGVIQALAKHGLLKAVDYLSTVSGGGYLGACLSSVLNNPKVGPDQARFPLQYQVGAKEPLSVGQLRQGARYLAPGGVLDTLRIPALLLRGILSNLLIFLFLVLLLVFATEFVYEIGTRIRLPFGSVALGVIVAFVILVMVSPLLSRVLRGRSSWATRNFEEMTFTLVLLVLLSIMFLVPMIIFVDQSLDASWIEVKKSIMANLLRPFEPRDSLQWLMVLAMLILFMVVGRASKHVAKLGGKILLIILGFLGPAFLFFLFLGLLAMAVDSPFITTKELFSLDATYADQFDGMGQVTPNLSRAFRNHHLRLSKNAQIVTLEEGLRWLLQDGERGFALVRGQGEVSVHPDYQYALNRGRVPPELRTALMKKGYRLGRQARSLPDLGDNRFKISGSHRYWVVHDPTSREWALEQIVTGPTIAETFQRVSYTIQISEVAKGVLIHEDVSFSDDDLGQAIRFVEQTNPHDVILLVDNSTPPFADLNGFRRAFVESLEKALVSLRPTVRLGIFWFDEHVYAAGTFQSLRTERKKTLLQPFLGDTNQTQPQVNFQGRLSNIPAAVERALREFREHGREGVQKSIVLVSDGIIEVTGDRHDTSLEEWLEQDFVRDAQTAGIRLYGIALSSRANFGLFGTMARQTGGTYYPVFESTKGVRFEDLFGAMEKIRAAAGSHLVSPFDQVTITDKGVGTKYTLTRDQAGIRIRATLRDHALTPGGLADPTEPWRAVFEDHGIELGDEASISQVSEGRWEVQDPYLYTISKNGSQLMIRRGAEDWGEGVLDLITAGIPSSIWDGRTDWVLGGIFGILLLYWLLVDINRISPHSFYRDRLSKAFLFRVTGSGALEHHDKQLLSSLNNEGSAAPYHLINVALNLQGSKDPSLRGRVSDFFIFSKQFIGSERTGYVKTREMEQFDSNLDLGTVMAISGAAAAPNAGMTTVKSVVFILTLLNIRMGYWLPNPRILRNLSWLTRRSLQRGPGPKYLLKESLGHLDTKGRYINVSDGGHIENLGLFELLRRRCKLIIAVDGERDPDMQFGSLVKLLLYARIDLGIEIDIDLEPLRKNEQGFSSTHWVLGTIRYADGETGSLLYIKASLTGDEYEYIRNYHSENSLFPHESTAEQFFTEARFEAYRGLGFHIGDQLFSNSEQLGVGFPLFHGKVSKE